VKIQRHKYNAKPTEIGAMRFDSKKEARYYTDLLIRQKLGEVLFFLRQVPFHLVKQDGKSIIYRIDFQEFHSDGTVHFVDVKGFKTKEYVIKKAWVEREYPITIEEI
jgi:hypothetical protein